MCLPVHSHKLLIVRNNFSCQVYKKLSSFICHCILFRSCSFSGWSSLLFSLVHTEKNMFFLFYFSMHTSIHILQATKWGQNKFLIVLLTGIIWYWFIIESLNHRMACVGRVLKDHPIPTLCHGQKHLPLEQVAGHPAWPWIPPGASTISLCNLFFLFFCFNTLALKNLLKIPNLNQLSFSLRSLSFFLSLHTLVNSPSPAFF